MYYHTVCISTTFKHQILVHVITTMRGNLARHLSQTREVCSTANMPCFKIAYMQCMKCNIVGNAPSILFIQPPWFWTAYLSHPSTYNSYCHYNYACAPSYGCLLAKTSYITIPKEYTSAAVVAVSPRSTSGAIQNGDPTFSLLLERPKSATFARKLSSIKRFDGFTSRCKTGGDERCR